ncbi:glycosyltransferase family 2 protein [Paenibacillus sp. P96]|uniref:Glycosyltransferase family 2 protein n=1 Tax=Paenibacillus zeirhizosphaerae TaxID=2987519 RepID=A0ABT9FVC1_9BACL|nr:glycosyltransferase family 2 protein [Paenibacillus sp. P96]MDP4098676.1 glycosyltransferase family 2 protein [Paenibacillus sp. P96]
MALVSIIMVTYNKPEMTWRCVDSIFRNTDIPFEIIFVDNASTDDTVTYLKTVPQATVIQNEENRGFAAGCNQGIRAARGDYILLLNNDTIVTAGWLTKLMEWLDAVPSRGIVGPMSTHVGPMQCVNDLKGISIKEIESYALERSRTYAGQGYYPHKLIGFCMLFRRSLVDLIGGLDERFYPGNYEDDDFCLRARIAGKSLWLAQDTFIYHEGQGSFVSKVGTKKYVLQSIKNAERFRDKWNIGLSPLEINLRGYNPSEIVAREYVFLPERHAIPL